jgi:anti-sigma regulatory factor (Ser/Thr protein kinase)
MTSNVLRLAHQPVAVGVARRRIRAELADVGVPGEVLDDVEVVVSELLGNAVRYARPIAGGVLLVGWRAMDDVIEVRVTDGGSGRVVEVREMPTLSDSGRGLRIVERLSTDWGVIDHVGGLRTVWAKLAVDPPDDNQPPRLRLVT